MLSYTGERQFEGVQQVDIWAFFTLALDGGRYSV